MTTLYPYELSDAALTSVNAQKALEHRANITSIEARVNSRTLPKIDGARQCHEECTSAINLLRTGSALGSREILDILSELRLNRAEFADVIISDALGLPTELSPRSGHSRPLEPKQIIDICKQQFEDATAVIDLAPAHSTPQMVCGARYNRISAVTTLNNSMLQHERNLPVDWDVKAKIAMVDANNQLADHHINAKQKEHAEIFAEVFADIVNRSIRPCFLTHSDLCQVEGLDVGNPRSKKFFIARNYSDKAGPITMSDGTPKPLPPTISIDRIATMSPSQLVKFLGPDNGIFFGENAFWKRHSGILLGKHKWEAEGDMERDTNTCSELWDMRWVFGNPENAKNFCKDMVEISRLGQNNGILDGLFKVEIKSSELESLDNSIEDLVFCSNKPLKKPSNNNTQGKFMMSMNPTAYLQSYTAVFVVGQCVVKTYIIEGYNASQKLERSCMFGPKGLLNTIAKTVSAWLDGNRTEFDSRAQQALPSVSSSDLSVCAACGVSQEKLQRCSRCKKVAYCCRDCQVADWKQHKGACKKAAAAAD